MARALACVVVVCWTLGGLVGCGGDAEPEGPTNARAEGAGSGAAAGAEAEAPSGGAGAAVPPELELVWLAGGGLALANVGDAPARIVRSADLSAGPGAPAMGGALRLAVDCAGDSSATVAVAGADAPADALAADCLTLVPGAAIALGTWPDARRECRCPPCLEPRGGPVSLTIRACGADQPLSLSAPPR